MWETIDKLLKEFERRKKFYGRLRNLGYITEAEQREFLRQNDVISKRIREGKFVG